MLLKAKSKPNSRLISGLDAARVYLAVKQHFNQNNNYSLVKFGLLGCKLSQSSYKKRRDYKIFERLADKYRLDELYDIYVSNELLESPKLTFELIQPDAKKESRIHDTNIEMFDYVYRDDLDKIMGLLKNNSKSFEKLSCGDGLPVIIQILIRKTVSLETIASINNITNILNIIDKEDSFNPIVDKWVNRIQRYEEILEFDKIQIAKILKNKLNKYEINLK